MTTTQSTTGDRNHLRAVDDERKGGRKPLGLSIERSLHARGRGSVRRGRPGSCAPRRSPTSAARSSSSRRDVEIPKSWSQLATNVVASKYFRGHSARPERERSVKQLIGRVVGRIREWGDDVRLLRARRTTRRPSRDELTHLLVTQKMAFNSPVWFNLGVAGHAAAGERLLHQLRRRHDGVDHGPREDRGDALQGRLGHGLEPVAASAPRRRSSRAAAPRRARSRSCAASTRSPAS